MKKRYLLILCLILISGYSAVACVSVRIRTYAQWDYKTAIKEIKTPEQVAAYLESYLISKDTQTWYSFKYVHQKQYALCAEYAFAATALLSDNGYPPLILQVYFEVKPGEKQQSTHACFVYKNESKWGTLGIEGENSPGTIFANLEDVCQYIEKNHLKKIVAYILHNLEGYNFIDGDESDIYNHWNEGKKIILNNQEPAHSK